MNDFIGIAKRWRERFGYIGRGGIIVIFDGQAQSWVNELRNPEDWRPGCLAVDEAGCSRTAVAGDEHHGALVWMPNDADAWGKGLKPMPPAQPANVMRHKKDEGTRAMTARATYRQPSITAISYGRLHRAIVSLPGHMAERDQPLQERTVFFECPRGDGAGAYLEDLLAKVWCVETKGWCEGSSTT